MHRASSSRWRNCARPRSARSMAADLGRPSPRNASRSTVTPPYRSASDTTPTGSEAQPRICGRLRAAASPDVATSSQTISDEPPPMSNSTTPSPPVHQRRAADTASSASVSRSTISRSRPISSRARAQELLAVVGRAAGFGRDQPRARRPRLRILSRQIVSASIARSIAASLSRPRRRHALAEPDDAGECVDHAKALANRAGDQQTAIVGAEIERRVGGTRIVMAPAAVLTRMAGWPAPTPRGPTSRLPSMRGVEAGRCPGLVVHQNTVLPRRSSRELDGRGDVCPRSKKFYQP